MNSPAANTVPDYREMLNVNGGAYVVLGAGQGIGEQSAHALAQAGARVMCVDLDPARADAVAWATGGIAHVADVTNRAEMARVFATAAQTFGAIAGVVDVVGMVLGGGLPSRNDEELARQFDLVFKHAWLTLQYAPQAMPQGGAIVFIGSIAGLVVRSGTLLAYSSSKAALHHLVKGAALELAPSGIRVNAIAPGLTRTPRLLESNSAAFWEGQARAIPLGRTGTPQDVAAGVLFLASPMSAFITGNILGVDGGSALSMGGGFGVARSVPGAA